MALFSRKDPMAKWRSRNQVAAAFVDHSNWKVHLDTGVVHTVIDDVSVVVLLHHSGNAQVVVIIEAGAQAERTLANTLGDDGGEPFEFEGWHGVVAPGSGSIEAGGSGGTDLYDKVMRASLDLAARTRHRLERSS